MDNAQVWFEIGFFAVTWGKGGRGPSESLDHCSKTKLLIANPPSGLPLAVLPGPRGLFKNEETENARGHEGLA